MPGQAPSCPAAAPRGPSLPPPLGWAVAGASASSAALGWVGALFLPVSFLSFLFLEGCVLGTCLFLIFLPFLLAPLLSLLPVLSPHPLDPAPLFSSLPSSSGPVGDLKGTVWHRDLGH